MLSARQVADFFLVIAAPDEGDTAGEGVTHLKLQKLVYYAQGFHLALTGQPLFPETIEAWEHGPVVRELYPLFANHGRRPIDPPERYEPGVYSDEVRDLLTDVWNAYGQFSAWALRGLTHEEPPWKDAYAQGSNTIISHEALRRYFVTQLA